jgi:hypothetical protein
MADEPKIEVAVALHRSISAELSGPPREVEVTRCIPLVGRHLLASIQNGGKYMFLR